MRIILSPSTSPSFNLAAEEFFFSTTGDDFLLLYSNSPSVIIGSNQAVLNEIDPDFCIEQDIRIVRRLSGGGAVYHDLGNLNYSFIQNKTKEPLSARFLDPVVSALLQMEIPVEVRTRKDLWLEGYKVSGTASHLSKGREIHHGTLLYDTDLGKLHKALNPERRNFVAKATASVPSPVKNIRQFLEESKKISLPPEEFFLLFAHQIGVFLETTGIETINNKEKENIETLQQEKYIQRRWNYRL